MSNRLTNYRAPLRHFDFRQLWFAQVLSELGDWGARLALAVLIFERTGSPTVTALSTAISVLPWVVIGQWLAAFGDRYPRRTLMVLCDLVRAFLFALMLLPVPVWALLVLAFLAGCATPPFAAARSALMPSTVDASEYPSAIAVSTLTSQFAAVGGYATGGGLVAVVGARWALGVNAATFLFSAMVLARLRGGRRATSSVRATTSVRMGYHAIVGDPFVRRAVGFYTVVTTLIIGGESLVPVYAVDELGRGGGGTIGALAAAVPLGAMLATFLLPVHGSPTRLLQVSAITVVIAGATGSVGFMAAVSFPLILVAFASLGAASASGVPANAVAGSRLPDAVRASAFGIIQGLLQGAVAVGAGLSGVVATYVGVRVTCICGLLATTLIGVWGLVRAPSPTPADEPTLGVG